MRLADWACFAKELEDLWCVIFICVFCSHIFTYPVEIARWACILYVMPQNYSSVHISKGNIPCSWNSLQGISFTNKNTTAPAQKGEPKRSSKIAKLRLTAGLNSSEWVIVKKTDCLFLPSRYLYPSKFVSTTMVRALQFKIRISHALVSSSGQWKSNSVSIDEQANIPVIIPLEAGNWKYIIYGAREPDHIRTSEKFNIIFQDSACPKNRHWGQTALRRVRILGPRISGFQGDFGILDERVTKQGCSPCYFISLDPKSHVNSQFWAEQANMYGDKNVLTKLFWIHC